MGFSPAAVVLPTQHKHTHIIQNNTTRSNKTVHKDSTKTIKKTLQREYNAKKSKNNNNSRTIRLKFLKIHFCFSRLIQFQECFD
jgi:hypothetical protein